MTNYEGKKRGKNIRGGEKGKLVYCSERTKFGLGKRVLNGSKINIEY
jgi:hypothetical protein